MAWNFSNDRAIFQQIADIISTDIISGKYAPGEKLAGVRDLAVTAGVNPNTMQHALAELESTGLIYSRRGAGRYISDDPVKIQEARKDMVLKHATEFVSTILSLGVSKERIIAIIQTLCKEDDNV